MLNFISKYWRIIRTGVSFGMFGLGAIFLTFIFFPLVLLLIKNPERRKRIIRGTISFCFKFFMYFMHYIGLFNFKVKRIEILKRESSCLLIANHPTLIDVVSIIAFLPNACCIVKKDLWDNKFIKGVVKAAGYIPNTNQSDFMTFCKEAIKNGDVLVIFPEGTRTSVDKELVFQRGTAHIALILDCPVRCVEISCSPITLTKGKSWYEVPSRRADFTLRVKGKLIPGDHIGADIPRPKAARILTRIFLKEYCHNESTVLP